MTRTFWWFMLILVSTAIVALDIVTNPYIEFPIAFAIPVGIGASYLSRGAGIFTAITLAGCRLGIATIFERKAIPLSATLANTGILLVALIGLAALVAAAQERHDLARRVRILEGILPICMFCKKIRRPDGVWEPIEAYVTQRSDAQFSHTFCETCGRENYGETQG